MNNEAMRIAIAEEVLAWTRDGRLNEEPYWWDKEGLIHYSEDAPDYPNDLNAMQEAWNTLNKREQDAFAGVLAEVFSGRRDFGACRIECTTKIFGASAVGWLETQLPFQVHRVTAGNLTENILKMHVAKDGRKYSRTQIPFFTRNHDGSQGKITFRACTYDFKIRPMRLPRRSRRVDRRTMATMMTTMSDREPAVVRCEILEERERSLNIQ